MLRQNISKEGEAWIERAISDIPQRNSLWQKAPNGYWVCYGSFATNSFNEKSDIDLLYVHMKDDLSSSRVQEYVLGRPVTVYALSEKDLSRDGKDALYGGYYAGKLLNPFAVFKGTEKSFSVLASVVAGFIAPFAAQQRKQLGIEAPSPSAVYADCIKGYLSICPWYQNYFLRLMSLSNFLNVWDKMSRFTTTALERNNSIEKAGDIYIYRENLSNYVSQEEILKRSARFWSLGAIFHGQDSSFVDFYIEKSIGSMHSSDIKGEITRMRNFLNQEQGGELP